MNPKRIVMTFFIIGSAIGGYGPMLFGISALSYTSIILGAVGGLIGVIVGYKISKYF